MSDANVYVNVGFGETASVLVVVMLKVAVLVLILKNPGAPWSLPTHCAVTVWLSVLFSVSKPVAESIVASPDLIDHT